MSENKMPAAVAWRCNWRKSGEIAWIQYHDETDPLPETWDARPNETLALYSAETVQSLQAEVERLRAENSRLLTDWAREQGERSEAQMRAERAELQRDRLQAERDALAKDATGGE